MVQSKVQLIFYCVVGGALKQSHCFVNDGVDLPKACVVYINELGES